MRKSSKKSEKAFIAVKTSPTVEITPGSFWKEKIHGSYVKVTSIENNRIDFFYYGEDGIMQYSTSMEIQQFRNTFNHYQ